MVMESGEARGRRKERDVDGSKVRAPLTFDGRLTAGQSVSLFRVAQRVGEGGRMYRRVKEPPKRARTRFQKGRMVQQRLSRPMSKETCHSGAQMWKMTCQTGKGGGDGEGQRMAAEIKGMRNVPGACLGLLFTRLSNNIRALLMSPISAVLLCVELSVSSDVR